MATFTKHEIAKATDKTTRTIERRAKKENWAFSEEQVSGGTRRLFDHNDLPDDVQSALIATFSDRFPKYEADEPEATQDNGYDPAALHQWANQRTEKQRAAGRFRADVCRELKRLNVNGYSMGSAIKKAAADAGVPANNVKNWWYGNPGKGAQHYAEADWDAALIPKHEGNKARKPFSPEAWDFASQLYLSPEKRGFREIHRRLVKAAEIEGWDVPGEKAMRLALQRDIPISEQILAREGKEAWRDSKPSLRRNPLLHDPGEIVVGDGFSVNRWVDWGDEVIYTSTAWIWKDIRAGRLLAHEFGKTESTELFRLATYRLTGICRPKRVYIDNTRAAANKQMTAGQPGRNRFKDRPEDPDGLLKQMGIDVIWASPDHSITTPGAKPIERDNRDLKQAIKDNVRIAGRGHAKANPIPAEEMRDVMAQIIAEHNARKKREHPACKGRLSFDDAWHEAVHGKTLDVASPEQRERLLLSQEVVTIHKKGGHIEISAGRTDVGKPRFHAQATEDRPGQRVVVYYDPVDLTQPVRVHDKDGRYICHAERLPDLSYDSVAEAAQWRKQKRRALKADQAAADARKTLSDMDMQRLTPAPDVPDEPLPKVSRAAFGRRNTVNVEGARVDPETGEVIEPARPVKKVANGDAMASDDPNTADQYESNFQDVLASATDQLWAANPLSVVRRDDDE